MSQHDNFPVSEFSSATTAKQRSAVERFNMSSDVVLEIRDKDGNLKHRSEQHNLRTNVGADFWNSQLFGTPGAAATYMAITADSTAAAAGDTTLASEQTTNGLARAAATVTHTTSATSTQLAHTWTYTGSSAVTLAKVGLFNAASAGTLVLETLLSSSGTVSANGDTIAVTWTVNY